MLRARNVFNREIKQLDLGQPAGDKSSREISGSSVELGNQDISIDF